MASSELIEALQALAHERKIDEFYLIDRLEASLAKSYQHILDLEWDARVTIDRQTGKIYVYELVPVGEPDEETGEIVVKGENVMVGYYNNPEATAAVFTDDGWFRTGDIGYMDKDGYIYITGRKKNVIILSNGKNVFPEEIEEHLSDRSDVIGESVVLGRPNASGETVITAVIYPNPDFSKGKTKEEGEAAVREAVTEVNKSLPVYKQVRDTELRDTEFEKTTTRKIKRFLVK